LALVGDGVVLLCGGVTTITAGDGVSFRFTWGAAVVLRTGADVILFVGRAVGFTVGRIDGLVVGFLVVDFTVGFGVDFVVGFGVDFAVGFGVGFAVGFNVGFNVMGRTVGGRAGAGAGPMLTTGRGLLGGSDLVTESARQETVDEAPAFLAPQMQNG
jgi:hypothetical protein